MKKIILFTLIMLVVFGMTVQAAETEITVSSKAFTEQLILGHMTLELLEEEGFPVKDEIGVGATDLLRPAMQDEEIDLYWEYTGTALTVVMEEDEITDSEKAFEKVKKWDEENNDIAWLDYASANNTYGIMVRENWGQEKDIETISDLADYIDDRPNSVSMATDTEFYERPDGLSMVEDKYEFKFGENNLTFLEIGLTYGALDEKEVDAAMGFKTDGRIEGFDLRMLEDDKNVFPVYNPAPTVRQEILDEHPGIKEPLAELAESLDTETLRNLNQKVDVDEEEPEEVAIDHLEEEGLIKK
ncbi:MAG: glycine betaine ABC transporter substrate-binding protein [Halanaerobiaceae bacterium]